MTDAYRTPGRDFDATEIRRAEIHEAAETRRLAISEREATRRKRTERLGETPYVAAVVVVLALVVGGALTAHSWMGGRAPCVESAELVSVTTSARECPKGGHLETEKTDGHVLVRCVCFAREGGAP